MSDNIKKTVMEAIDEVFKPKNSVRLSEIVKQPDFKFEDFGASSLQKVEFCMQIEESIDVEIELSDLMDHPTFLDFVSWLEQQAGGA